MFIASPVLETRLTTSNTTVCYDIPSTDICPYGIRFLWPKINSNISCSCPVHNSSDGIMVFGDCVPCESAITPLIMENGSICFSAPTTTIAVHFECLNNELCIYECNEQCTEGDCFIRNILASHRVIIAGKVHNDIVLVVQLERVIWMLNSNSLH
jgi:hypothetical protein